ncbi:serine/threonine protein kinase [Streptacidiphilus sp. MAP12-16]|uniref:serine/threonine-protein kinase n=1 Tax=Streptacidiphilus sp. MAP12-16 TaxID=3156300 RepID=UPI003517C0D6
MGTEEGSVVGSARGEEPVRGTGTRGPATSADVAAPRMLAGRYLLGDRLGRGGMGTVWRAQDQMLDREVAVKELSVGHLAEEDLLIVQSRMKQEARAAARIKHPGVITIHDVLEQDGKPWIVMELIDGRSLAELVEQEGTLNPREAAGIGAQVLAALHRGHQVGVIHRDVKPANVLLERGTGRVVLTDFGIATYEGDSALTRTGDLIGSPDYLAPERVHGSRPGPESDLWGLGATLYAAVEGQSPFRRESPLTTLAAVVTDPLPEPRNAGALAPVLRALMEKAAAERPSAPEAIRMLERVAAGDTTSISAPPSPLRSPTTVVPPADRNEHMPTPFQRTEPIRPAFLESEYRPTSAAGSPPSTAYSAAPSQAPSTARPNDRQQRQAAGSGRRRRVWPWLVIAGLLAALAGGGAAYEVSRNGSADQTANNGQDKTTPSPSAHATDAPVIPQGYTVQHDPAGFSFPLPEGQTWTRVAKGTVAINYSPDNQDHLLIFGVTPGQGISPLQHAQEMAASLTTNDHSYQLESLEQDTFRGYTGARWSFTFTMNINGVPEQRHAIEQLYKDSTGTEYDIYLAYPQSVWTRGYQRFLDIIGGFSTP